MRTEITTPGGADLPLSRLIAPDPRPLVVHVVHQLIVGGMENGLVNLINHGPEDSYRHAVVSISRTDRSFARRLRREDVAIITANKAEGQDWPAYGRVFRLLRQLRPAILHTRTLATLEVQIYGALAGVQGRVHGEHGQASLKGMASLRNRALRRLTQPLIGHYIAVSRDLANCLTAEFGIANSRVSFIANGVDTVRFAPRLEGRSGLPAGFADRDSIVIGTSGRMQPIKDPLTLVRAFVHVLDSMPEMRSRLRLLMIGGGPLLQAVREVLRQAGAENLAWLPGDVDNVPALLPQMDLFVLPSISEGMSNAILEAMACGLPVIANHVGGNSELVEDGRTGILLPSADSSRMADAIASYVRSPGQRAAHGKAGRLRAENSFSLDAMVRGYLGVYDAQLSRAGLRRSRECAA